jgi:uncharacterized protein YciI
MLVGIMCFDKPGHVDLRMKTRDEHLNWIQRPDIELKYAGPMLDDEEKASIGSLIIAEVEDLATARAIFAEDPYNKAGLFERVVIVPTRKVFGEIA